MTAPETSRQCLANEIFDPVLFEEFQGLLGAARAQALLEQMSSSLCDVFPDLSEEKIDPGNVYRPAHKLVAQAGMMGFVGLRDACQALQKACATETKIGPEYARAREAALAARDVAIVLLQRSS